MLSHEDKQALNTICHIHKTTNLFKNKNAVTNIILITTNQKQATGIVLNKTPYTPTQRIKQKFTQQPIEQPRDKLSTALENLGLAHEYYPYDTTLEITQTQEQLKKYKHITKTQPRDKQYQLGNHYDYPEYAVQNFHQTDPDTIKHHIKTNTPLSYQQYKQATRFTNYICPPLHSAINQTLKLNAERADLLDSLETHDYPNLHEFVQKELKNYTEITTL